MTQSVLAAVDLGPGTEAVVQFASTVARGLGGGLTVLHVISPEEQQDRAHNPGDSRFVDVMVDETVRTLRERADAAGAGDLPLRCVARVGDPVDAVLAEGAENDAVIVIGMRRRSRVGKFLLGSDLQEILLAARSPIVAVPLEEDAP